MAYNPRPGSGSQRIKEIRYSDQRRRHPQHLAAARFYAQGPSVWSVWKNGRPNIPKCLLP